MRVIMGVWRVETCIYNRVGRGGGESERERPTNMSVLLDKFRFFRVTSLSSLACFCCSAVHACHHFTPLYLLPRNTRSSAGPCRGCSTQLRNSHGPILLAHDFPRQDSQRRQQRRRGLCTLVSVCGGTRTTWTWARCLQQRVRGLGDACYKVCGTLRLHAVVSRGTRGTGGLVEICVFRRWISNRQYLMSVVRLRFSGNGNVVTWSHGHMVTFFPRVQRNGH